jgi:DNA-binding XRE family transcriptional regulator
MSLETTGTVTYNHKMVITVRQLRAARVLLGWSQEQAAQASGISINSFNSIERGVTDPRTSTWHKIIQAFVDNGVEFIADGGSSLAGGEGVRLRQPKEERKLSTSSNRERG